MLTRDRFSQLMGLGTWLGRTLPQWDMKQRLLPATLLRCVAGVAPASVQGRWQHTLLPPCFRVCPPGLAKTRLLFLSRNVQRRVKQSHRAGTSRCLPAKDRGNPSTISLCPATAEQLLFLGQAGVLFGGCPAWWGRGRPEQEAADCPHQLSRHWPCHLGRIA